MHIKAQNERSVSDTKGKLRVKACLLNYLVAILTARIMRLEFPMGLVRFKCEKHARDCKTYVIARVKSSDDLIDARVDS